MQIYLIIQDRGKDPGYMRILEKPNKKNVREWRRAEYRQKNTKIEVHRIHEGIIIFF